MRASLVLVSIGVLSSCVMVIFARDWIQDIFHVNSDLLIITLLIIVSSSSYTLFYSALVASLKTKVLPIIIIISQVLKLILAIGLYFYGSGILGLAIGYTFGQILASVLLYIYTTKIFKQSPTSLSNKEVSITLRNAFRELLSASITSWIPLLVFKVGSELGTIVIFGYQGSSEAGVYFIVLSIAIGIMSAIFSLSRISLPVLSSIKDGRKKFAWQTIRLSSIITLPLTCSLIFYSEEILQLLGQNYIEGSLPFQIILISMLPTAILTGITTLVYSYGNYRRFLLISLATNIPRTALYFVLVPIYGIIGAAASYTIGSIIGLIVSVVVANRIGMTLFWKDLVLIVIIPTSIAMLLSYLQVNYIIGILSVILISYALLLKLQIVTRSDLSNMAVILPYSVSLNLMNLMTKLGRKLKRSY
jgi:O-antigen/teichoic acid export membrane protein